MPPPYTKIMFTNAAAGGITAQKLNLLVDDLSAAIAAGGGGAGTGDMTKAVYDVNGDGISDHAALSDTAPWTGITGKPTSFAPSVHASTHLAAGSDPIALATSVLAGLCPAVDNITIQIVTSKLSCVALGWTAITGKPSTFPPDSTAMLKATYDTNGDGISDHAALSDAVPWTGVTGKPATFPPDPHQASHVTGADQIPNATTSVRGLMPQANGNANAFYSSDGTQKQVSYTMLSGSQPGPAAHALSHLDNGTDAVPIVTTLRTGLAPKLSGNAATYLDGTGAYSAVSGSVNPGAWTNVTLGGGWTAPTQAQYRIEINGAVSTVYFRGMVQAAYSALATTAFTVPVGAFPSMTRRAVLGGAQNTGTATDVASYIASVSSAGVCTVYALTAGPFVWFDPAQTQQVYLDGLTYSL